MQYGANWIRRDETSAICRLCPIAPGICRLLAQSLTAVAKQVNQFARLGDDHFVPLEQAKKLHRYFFTPTGNT